MTLTYEEGMATLRSVFPAWDPEVLAQLLEANDGHLENTIDMALSMEPPQASTAPTTSLPPAPPSTPGYASQQREPRASPRSQPRRSRVTLADDFLRLPTGDDDSSQSGRPVTAQEREDAALAQMLQNEIFRQELFENEEFSAHFRDSQGRESISRSSGPREKTATEIANETFNTMSAKFSVMSETMKKKAHEMYLKFQTRADAPAKKDPYSHRPLMQDDSSDEDDDGADARGSSGDIRLRHAPEPSHPNAFSPSASRGSSISRRGHAGGTNKKDD